MEPAKDANGVEKPCPGYGVTEDGHLTDYSKAFYNMSICVTHINPEEFDIVP